MRLRDRPLLVAGIDSDLYVPRPELEKALLSAVRDERNLLVVGGAGSGKTTLLRRLEAEVRDELPVAWIDGGLPVTALDFLQQLARALPPERALRKGRPASLVDATDSIKLLDAIDDLPQDGPALVIVDDPIDETLTYDLFGRLRDRLWRLPFVWIVSTRPERLGSLRAPPADAFWAGQVEVGELDSSQIEELLRRGLDDSELSLVQQASWTPLNDSPRRVVRWAQMAVEGDVTGARERLTDRELKAAAIGRPASMLLAELEALDRPVTANDPELLRRLGWSRPYAARWLSALENAGVARSYAAPVEGQGRPPKLYELS